MPSSDITPPCPRAAAQLDALQAENAELNALLDRKEEDIQIAQELINQLIAELREMKKELDSGRHITIGYSPLLIGHVEYTRN